MEAARAETWINGLHYQQQSHDLGDTGGFQSVVGVMLVEDLSRLLLHKKGGPRIHLGTSGNGGLGR